METVVANVGIVRFCADGDLFFAFVFTRTVCSDLELLRAFVGVAEGGMREARRQERGDERRASRISAQIYASLSQN